MGYSMDIALISTPPDASGWTFGPWPLHCYGNEMGIGEQPLTAWSLCALQQRCFYTGRCPDGQHD